MKLFFFLVASKAKVLAMFWKPRTSSDRDNIGGLGQLCGDSWEAPGEPAPFSSWKSGNGQQINGEHFL